MSELDAVPGRWICRRCGFLVTKVGISMATGTMGADARLQRENCPNGCGLLVQATEKDLEWDCPICSHQGNHYNTDVCAGCKVDLNTDEGAELIRRARHEWIKEQTKQEPIPVMNEDGEQIGKATLLRREPCDCPDCKEENSNG